MAEERLAIDRLVDGINEGDPVRRTQLLAATWAPAGRLTIAGDRMAASLTELHDAVLAWQEDPTSWIELLSSERDGAGERGRWRVRGRDLRTTTFALSATLDAKGRIAELQANEDEEDAERPPSTIARLLDTAIANPIAATGVIGGAFYLALRLPMQIFYGQLGVSPDDIGFGAEVLVPQSLALVVAFLTFMGAVVVIAYVALPAFVANVAADRLGEPGRTGRTGVKPMLWIAGVVGFLLPVLALERVGAHGDWWGASAGQIVAICVASACAAVFLRVAVWVLRRRSPALSAEMTLVEERQRRSLPRRRTIQAMVLLTAVYGALLLVALPFWANSDAEAVRDGHGVAGGRLTPWRALPVSLHWSHRDHVRLVNDCRTLRLLGTGSGQLVLYDTRLRKLFRVPIAEASASVDWTCV
jgi:hypothetical protein